MSDKADGKRLRRRWIRWPAILIIMLAATAGSYYLYVFELHCNFRTVVAGQVYRSAQPSHDDLVGWKREYGLKTVINLRGVQWEEDSSIRRGREAVKKAGLNLIDISLSSALRPSPDRLRELIDALETAPRPILIHCQSGVNRSGAASVLAAMAVGSSGYTEARKQLSARYLHFNNDPDRIVGLFLRYEAYCRDKGLGTGGWKQFKQWALTEY